MENTIFLFPSKEKIEIAMPRKMKVRIVSIVAFVDQSKSILLQTPRADVFNIETKSSVKTQILFDTGSQQCYVNEKVRKHLNLKTIRIRKNINKDNLSN